MSTVEKIKDLMTAQKMSVADLSRATGLNHSTISRYLSGKVKPKQDSVKLIAAALHVHELYLLSDDPSAIAPDYVVELGDKHLVIEHYLSLDSDAQDEVARFIEYQLSKQKTSGSSEADK